MTHNPYEYQRYISPKHYWRSFRRWKTDPFRKRTSLAEGIAILLTLAIATVGFLQWIVYEQQVAIMKSASPQTDQLITAAKMSAHSADHNAVAATSFAQSADSINQGISEAVRKLNRQAVATEQSAEAAKSAAKTANESLVSVQRAFIFPTGKAGFTKSNDAIPKTNLRLLFSNSGLTPTKQAMLHINYLYTFGTFPKVIPYGDLGGEENTPTIFPPKAEDAGVILPIETFVMDGVTHHTMSLRIFGWVKYRDIFPGTPMHLTEVCFDVADGGTDANGPQYAFNNCFTHNCFDEQCEDYKEQTSK